MFALGAAAGIVGTGAYVKHRMEPFIGAGPPPIGRLLMRRLSRDLDLTEDQRRTVERIFDQMGEKLLELRQKYQPEIETVIENGLKSVKTELNDRQKKQMDAVYARLKQRWRRRGRFGRFGPPEAETVLSRLRTSLRLTPEQQEKIRPIIIWDMARRREIRRKYRQKAMARQQAMRAELRVQQDRTAERLAGILTKAQMNAYLEMHQGPGPER